MQEIPIDVFFYDAELPRKTMTPEEFYKLNPKQYKPKADFNNSTYDKKIKKCLAGGMSLVNISDKLNIPYDLVRKRASKNGWR